MKKFMSLLLVGIMMLSLVACGKSGGGKGELNVGVFYYTYSDTYISSVRTALDNALTEAGIKYQNYDGNSNQTTQNEQIDTAIAQGTNLLIVNIVTSGSVDASQAIVDKASAAGIPVIFFNRAVESDEDEGKELGSYDKCAFVGTDAPEAGHMQGKMVGQYVVDNFDAIDLNGDGKISYAMFMWQLGNVEAIYRTQYGVEDADAVITAAGKPALEYFDASNTDKYQVDQDGNWSATAANNYMTTNLSQYNGSAGNNIALVIYGILMAQIIGENLLAGFIDNHFLMVLAQTVISTLIILVTGEFLPKTLFKINPNMVLNVFAVPLFICYVVLYPISKLSSGLSCIFLRIFGMKVNKDASDKAFGKVDLDYFVQSSIDNAENEEELDTEVKIFQNALDFSKI